MHTIFVLIMSDEMSLHKMIYFPQPPNLYIKNQMIRGFIQSGYPQIVLETPHDNYEFLSLKNAGFGYNNIDTVI